MFETVFADARDRKIKQDNLNTFRAAESYYQVRRDNPNMIEHNSNIVDFSNPESVARIQHPISNPYGYNTFVSNPNIKPPEGYSPYNQYGNNWGGFNSGAVSVADTEKFMIPLPGDKRIPRGKHAKERPECTRPYGELSYTERKHLPIPVRVKKVSVYKQPTKPKICTKVFKPYHEPHTPFTIEELNSDYYTLRYIEQTPLNWTTEDAKNLLDICEKLRIYDMALACVVLEFACDDIFKNYSRQRYEKMLKYLEDKLKDYKKGELSIRFVDYKSKYRYRPTPSYSIDEEGKYIIPVQMNPDAKRVKNELLDEWEYSYDRGRDWLTEEEWTVFRLKAIEDLWRALDKEETIEFAKLNEIHANPIPQEEPKLPPYNPYDPISVKLHNQYNAERAYNINRDFYRYVFRHRLTDEEFDNWWYGTNTVARMQARGQKLSREEEHRRWAQQMNVNHLRFLETLKPIDYTRQANYWKSQILKALDNYNNGMVRPNMSLAEYMSVLGYLGGNRPHELEIQRQIEENEYYQNKKSLQDNFHRTLVEYFNNFPGQANPNPYYTPHYGTVDPRYGLPSHYIDMTNSPERQALKERTKQAVLQTDRHQRLHILYK